MRYLPVAGRLWQLSGQLYGRLIGISRQLSSIALAVSGEFRRVMHERFLRS